MENSLLEEKCKMSEKAVSKICKSKGFYSTPELNEKLYLHFLGFSKIENIEGFYNCKALWLENNNISSIENLEALTSLTSLFLHHNAIKSFVRPIDQNQPSELETLARIKSNWLSSNAQSEWPIPMSVIPTCSSLPSVRSLNVSHNSLTTLLGLSFMFPNVEKLHVGHNYLEDVSPELERLQQLSVLDLSFNRIGMNAVETSLPTQKAIFDPQFSFEGMKINSEMELRLIGLIAQLTKLSSFIFNGNVLLQQIKNYRRKLICFNSNLKFIDEYPVFDEERRTSEMFGKTGPAAEKQEKDVIRLESEKAHVDTMRRVDEMLLRNVENTENLGEIYIPRT